MSANFEFKKYSSASNEALSEMYFSCFQIRVSPKYFEWKYEKNPEGKVVAFEAWQGNQIAGFYGIIPEAYIENEIEITCFQSMDTMTHPNFQRMGLFSKLAQLTYKEAESLIQGQELKMIGIPGKAALPGFTGKLGWIQPGNFPLIFQNNFFIKNHSMNGYSFHKIFNYSIIEKYFQARCSKRILREKKIDWPFFYWKIINNPTKKFEVWGLSKNDEAEGLLVSLDMGNGKCLISWIDSRIEKNLEPVAKAMIYSLSRNKKWLYSWEPNHKTLNNAYKSCRFILNPFNRGPFSHRVPLILWNKNSQSANWLDFKKFHFQPIIQD